MPKDTAEVELVPDFQDYSRAALRLLMLRRPFQLLLLLTALAILFALFMVLRSAATLGLARAVLSQAPILVFGLLPATLYFLLLGQGQRMIAEQRKTNERVRYRFDVEGYDFLLSSDAGPVERRGSWADFARLIETPADFLLFFPGSVGIFLPKHRYASPEDVQRFRELARRNLGSNARLLS